MFSWWDRWRPFTGVISIVLLVIGLLFTLGTPGSSDSDAKIVSYYAKHSHQRQGWIGFFLTVAGILLFVVFVSVLRELLITREGQPGRLTALVYGAGMVSAAIWTIGLLTHAGPAITADDTKRYHVDPNAYRLLGDTTYVTAVAAVMIAALVVWGTSRIALRSGLLPRWYAQLGILVGVVQLFAFVFFPILVWAAWVILTSIFLTFRRPATTT